MSKLPIPFKNPHITPPNNPLQTALKQAQQPNPNSHYHEHGPVIDQLTPAKMNELHTGLQAYRTRVETMPEFNSRDEEELMLTIRYSIKYRLSQYSLTMSAIFQISASEAPFYYDNTEDLRYVFLQTIDTIITNIDEQLRVLPNLTK